MVELFRKDELAKSAAKPYANFLVTDDVKCDALIEKGGLTGRRKVAACRVLYMQRDVQLILMPFLLPTK